MNRATTALFALAVACIVGSAAAAVEPSPQAVQRTLPPPVPMTTAQKNALLAAKKKHVRKSDSGETFSMSRLRAGQGYLDAYNVAYLSSAGIVLDGSQPGAVATLWYQPTGRAREHLVVWTLNADGPGTVQLSRRRHRHVDRSEGARGLRTRGGLASSRRTQSRGSRLRSAVAAEVDRALHRPRGEHPGSRVSMRQRPRHLQLT